MSLIKGKQRRLVLAAATCAAILSPAAALAAPAHPGVRPAAAPPHCRTAQLRVWVGVPGDSATGHTAYQLELSNISSHSCTLFGFPGVSAVGVGGKRLGSAARRDHFDPTKLVTLGRAATAHVFLLITNVAFFTKSACEPANAIGLRVFPPNDTTSTVVPFPFRACKKRGPIFLRVRTTVARTGIPGFSS